MKQISYVDAADLAANSDRTDIVAMMPVSMMELTYGAAKKMAADGAIFAVLEPGAEECATPHKASKTAKEKKRLDIDVRKVAELKAAGKTVAEMADAAGVTPKQMSQWIYNNKTKVEESMQQLRDARELAKICCGKEGA